MLRTDDIACAPASRWFVWLVVACLAIGASMALAASAPVQTDALNSDPAVREAYQHFYNLDYDAALSRFEQISAAHPGDPVATAYVLHCILFRELYRLDLLDTTFYANDGFLTGKHTVIEDPTVRDQINNLSGKVIEQADARLKANPNDLDALFARGWARSIDAVYQAMVERNFAGGLHLALQAHGDHQHLLDKDPGYVDAKMVVGIYQYVVGSLSFGFKILVGVAGISGSKSKGMELLRDSAAHGVITSIESRTCIALFLRRDGDYQQAIAIVRGQAKEYPRDFLFALEEANLLKDDGQGEAAITAYRHLLSEAKAPGRYPNAHLELAYFGLGDTLRGRKMFPEAVAAFQVAALQSTVSPELKRRCLLAAGEVYDLLHNHEKARDEYQEVIAAGADTTQAAEARKYMRSGYIR